MVGEVLFEWFADKHDGGKVLGARERLGKRASAWAALLAGLGQACEFCETRGQDGRDKDREMRPSRQADVVHVQTWLIGVGC